MKMNRKWILIIVLVLAGFALGYLLRGGGAAAPDAHEGHADAGESQVTDWTCSMHPQIHQPAPGQCPICGMDLIPASRGDDSDRTLVKRLCKLREWNIVVVRPFIRGTVSEFLIVMLRPFYIR